MNGQLESCFAYTLAWLFFFLEGKRWRGEGFLSACHLVSCFFFVVAETCFFVVVRKGRYSCSRRCCCCLVFLLKVYSLAILFLEQLAFWCRFFVRVGLGGRARSMLDWRLWSCNICPGDKGATFLPEIDHFSGSTRQNEREGTGYITFIVVGGVAGVLFSLLHKGFLEEIHGCVWEWLVCGRE